MTNQQIVDHFLSGEYGGHFNRRYNFFATQRRRPRFGEPAVALHRQERRGILQTSAIGGWGTTIGQGRDILAVRYSDGTVLVNKNDFPRHQKAHKELLMRTLRARNLRYTEVDDEVLKVVTGFQNT